MLREEYEKKRAEESATAGAASGAASGAAAGAAAGAGKKTTPKPPKPTMQIPVAGKKRKHQASPAAAAAAAAAAASSAEEMESSPTETVVAVVPWQLSPPPTNTEGLLDGVLSPEVLRTDEELEVLHQEIVQTTAEIIDAICSLDIYALAWFAHNLEESKNRFKKEYARKAHYIKFAIQKISGLRLLDFKRLRLSSVCNYVRNETFMSTLAIFLTMG